MFCQAVLLREGKQFEPVDHLELVVDRSQMVAQSVLAPLRQRILIPLIVRRFLGDHNIVHM